MTESAVLPTSACELPTQAGRRRDDRFPCDLKGQVRPSGNVYSTGVWPVAVRDISASGLALVLNRRFEPKTTLIVELLEDGQVFQTFLVRVVRVQKLANGAWLVGCVLARRLDENELQSLVRIPLAA